MISLCHTRVKRLIGNRIEKPTTKERRYARNGSVYADVVHSLQQEMIRLSGFMPEVIIQ